MRPQMAVLPVALLLLVVALIAGVSKLLTLHGVIDQPPLPSFLPHHGQMMVLGFLAILLATERYIGSLTFRLHPSVHVMPFLVAAGAILQVIGWVSDRPPLVLDGAVVLIAGMAIYIYLLVAVGRQSAQPLPFRYMILGAALLILAAAIGTQKSPENNLGLSLLMMGFPIVTILGERVELTRFVAPDFQRWADKGFVLVALASAVVLAMALGWPQSRPMSAPVTLLLAGAVVPLALAERPLMSRGEKPLHRYLGRHLAVAYSWLLFGLVLLLVLAGRGASPGLFDASTHALAMGFVGSMILAHAPLILPALIGGTIREERLTQLPLWLLTAGILVRVWGDLAQEAELSFPPAMAASALLTVAAIIAFAVMMARAWRSQGTAPEA